MVVTFVVIVFVCVIPVNPLQVVIELLVLVVTVTDVWVMLLVWVVKLHDVNVVVVVAVAVSLIRNMLVDVSRLVVVATCPNAPDGMNVNTLTKIRITKAGFM